jgi:glutaryl-CoA dehydrogenase
VRDSVRRFVDEEVLPIIGKHYVEGTFPRHLIPKMGELGVFGANLPEEYGCAGLNNVQYGLIMQELERGDSGIRSFASVQGALVMYPIYAFGSEAQKQEWLPKMARGEAIGCFGLTEPDFGSNPSGMITVAREQADGSFVLNGAKMWITNGSQAHVSVVWAKTVRHGETEVGSDKTIRGFLVPTDAPGFRARDQKGKLSLRASDTSELTFEDVRLPADADPAEQRRPQEPADVPHAGALRHLVGRARRRHRLLRGGHGVRQDARDVRPPIGGFQIQQVRLAEMLTEITKGQLLSLHLGRCKDQGTFTPTMVSLAKRNNVDIATDVAREARRLLGGNGILAEYASMRHMANLESVYTYEGTHDVHSLILGQAITGLNAFK